METARRRGWRIEVRIEDISETDGMMPSSLRWEGTFLYCLNRDQQQSFNLLEASRLTKLVQRNAEAHPAPVSQLNGIEAASLCIMPSS